METSTLQWLVEIADGSTVAAVAERHHISQPAVTRGLKRLAAEIGVPLTERTGRRLALTFAGARVVTAARRVDAELTAARAAIAEDDDPDTGTVRLGFLSPLGGWLVPELLARFRELHPGARVQLRHDGAARILAALRAGELDLLLTESPADDPDLRCAPLGEDELVLGLPRGHRLAGRRSVAFGEVAAERWVLQPTGYGTRRAVEALAASADVALTVAYEDHDLATLRAIVGAGSGVGLFADRPGPPPDVAYVSLRPRLRRTVGLVTRPNHVMGGAARAFAELVRDEGPTIARGAG